MKYKLRSPTGEGSIAPYSVGKIKDKNTLIKNMNSFDSKFRTYSTYSKKNPTGLIYYYKPVKYLSVHAIIPLYLESLFISLLLSSNG